MVRVRISDLLNETGIDLRDYSKMKGRLILQLLSTNEIGQILDQIPHRKVEDMVLICRFDLGTANDGLLTALITNKFLDLYGIDEHQLFHAAMLVAESNRPSIINKMDDILLGLLLEAGVFIDMDWGSSPFYVASVTDGCNGACVICYPGFLDRAANKIGGDFFILPSSIHEVLLLPDNGMLPKEAPEYLESMVREVNQTLAPDERLSNMVYHYDSKAKVFETARHFEARKRLQS